MRRSSVLSFFVYGFLFLFLALQCKEEEKKPSIHDAASYFSTELSALKKQIHPLAERTGLSNEAVLKYLKELDGNDEYKIYIPDTEEKKIFVRAYDSLPGFLKRNLDDTVLGIYFVDNFASTGYTEWTMSSEGKIYSFLVFHPRIFKQTISEMLTERVRSAFISSDCCNVTISLDGNLPAVFYILLHESVHAADYTYRLTDFTDPGSREIQEKIKRKYFLGDDIWSDFSKVKKKYDHPLREKISFYGFKKGPHLKYSETEELFDYIQKSPFISLYGALYRAEDLAELISMYHLTQKEGREYTVKYMKDGKSVREWKPADSESVRKRFQSILFIYE